MNFKEFRKRPSEGNLLQAVQNTNVFLVSSLWKIYIYVYIKEESHTVYIQLSNA